MKIKFICTSVSKRKAGVFSNRKRIEYFYDFELANQEDMNFLTYQSKGNLTLKAVQENAFEVGKAYWLTVDEA
jgi:hypothetical protein